MARSEPSIGEYTPAGYPSDNPAFREDARKLLERTKVAEGKSYARFVEEWTARLREMIQGGKG